MTKNTYRMTITALFIALTLLLGMTPLGLIPLGFINVTILCIPVIVGTIMLGLKSGLLLGAFFGLASTLSMCGLSLTAPSALASALLAANPFLAIVMCMLPRLCVPAVAYFTHKWLKSSLKAVPVAAIAGSLTNTVLYLGLMLAFYKICGIDDAKVLAIIGGTGLVAGGCEAAAAAIIATPVVAALSKIQEKTKRGNAR